MWVTAFSSCSVHLFLVQRAALISTWTSRSTYARYGLVTLHSLKSTHLDVSAPLSHLCCFNGQPLKVGVGDVLSLSSLSIGTASCRFQGSPKVLRLHFYFCLDARLLPERSRRKKTVQKVSPIPISCRRRFSAALTGYPTPRSKPAYSPAVNSKVPAYAPASSRPP